MLHLPTFSNARLNSFLQFFPTTSASYVRSNPSADIGTMIALTIEQGPMKEEKIMADKILTPLKRYDRIEEIIPYLKEITKPMKLAFLFPSTYKVVPAQEALGNRVEIDVEFYAGTLRKALRSYSPDGDGHLNVIRAAHAHPTPRLSQLLIVVLILGMLGLSAVPTGAEERPTPDHQTTIFDPSVTNPR